MFTILYSNKYAYIKYFILGWSMLKMKNMRSMKMTNTFPDRCEELTNNKKNLQKNRRKSEKRGRL